jgi:3-oxoacyl-[acyl-carrier protein] reductase
MHKAIVTGGSRGIGFGIAKALVESGASVMITGRDEARLADAVAELKTQATGAAMVAGRAMDVRRRSAVDAMVTDAVKEFGTIDTLINNAGVGHFTDVEHTTDDDWARVIDTNLTGVFYCSRAAVPVLKAGGGGWIINIASLAGRNYFANAAAYCASKAGLVAFSEALMLEVRASNIRVSVIMPGSVATDFDGPSGHVNDETWKLTPDDIGEVVMDLLRHPSRSLPSKVEIRPAKTRS